MNRPSDVEKLSSDKRLAWRALSTLGTQLFLMDPALSVEEAPSAAGMPTATVTFSIPNGHTLAKGPRLRWECFLIMRISCTPIATRRAASAWNTF